MKFPFFRQKAKVETIRIADVFMQCAVAFLLLLPLIFSKPENGKRINITLPSVYNGDEPHYLIMMSSLVQDGDLDLKNNYIAVHEGAAQAGKWFAGTPIGHHTYWYVDGKYYSWWDEFGVVWRPDKSGHLLPQTADTALCARVSQLPEYSVHPPGIALVMAPALYPFRNSKLFEPLSIIYGGLIMVFAMFFFRVMLRAYTNDVRTKTLLCAVVFLGSPLWYYARALFSEGTMTLLAISAYALYISKKKTILPGLLIGLGMLFKPVFAVLAIPPLFELARNKEWGRLGRFFLGIFLGTGAFLLINYRMNGSIFKAMQPFIMGSTAQGAWGLLLNAKRGLAVLCPALIIAGALWPAFIRKFGRTAWLPAFGALLYLIVVATYGVWRGGDSYGPRYLVPVVPFILLPVLLFVDRARRFTGFKRGLGAVLIIVSVFINANAAITSWKFIDRNPLVEACVKFGKLLY
jgi:hypothetical protein